MADSKHIKCAFCDWKTPRFRTLKSGKTKGPEAAFDRLKGHVSWNHPAKYKAIFGEESK